MTGTEVVKCHVCANDFPAKRLLQFAPRKPDAPWFRCCLHCAGEVADNLRDSGCPGCLVIAMTIDRSIAMANETATDEKFMQLVPQDLEHLSNCPRKDA